MVRKTEWVLDKPTDIPEPDEKPIGNDDDDEG